MQINSHSPFIKRFIMYAPVDSPHTQGGDDGGGRGGGRGEREGIGGFRSLVEVAKLY